MKEESRFISDSIELEERAEGTPTIRGRAIPFNEMSNDLGGFREIISPNALDGCDMEDVIACFNHNEEKLLGRSSSGTLKMEVRPNGLFYSVDLPDNTAGRDCAVSVRRKDIKGASFKFFTGADDWAYSADGTLVRTILQIRKIKDISPVVFPAYPQTDVAVRSMGTFQESIKKPGQGQVELQKLKLQLKTKLIQ